MLAEQIILRGAYGMETPLNPPSLFVNRAEHRSMQTFTVGVTAL